MSKTNCVNCGAAKEVDELTCPFCGTKYADLTTIDLMSREPIYIQLKRGGQIVASKAYITGKHIDMQMVDYARRDSRGHLHIHPMNRASGTIEFVMEEW